MKIGVDVGGTWLRLGAWDGTAVRGLERLPAVRSARALADALRGYIERSCPGGAESVALGIPGTLDRARRTVLNTPNLPLGGVPLADELEQELGVPVILDNDVTMLLRGDIALLGRGVEGLTVGLYAGTGLGGAVFLDGRPLAGKHGICEPGHMPVPGRTERCTCGGTGCAENYVSGRRLMEIAAELGTGVGSLFTQYAEHTDVLRFLDDLAAVAAGIAVLLDPDLMILGGGVVCAPGFPRDKFAELIRAKCMHPVPGDSLDIVFSSEAPELGVLGAALTEK